MGHFNPYPVEIGGELSIDPATATIDEIFQEGRDLGARVIQANHASNPYGYFTSLDSGDVPGGYNPNFEVIEVNACCEADTWEQAQAYWNRHLSGELERFYPITAGSDVHDVWTERSGVPRLYAHVDGDLTVGRFVGAVEAGHAYATSGPLMRPRSAAGADESVLFGKRFEVAAGEPFEFSLDLTAMEGLQRVALVREGEVVEERDLSDRGKRAEGVAFAPVPEADAWYALVVEDASENLAYSNPVWISTR